jgi:hypothetical protein
MNDIVRELTEAEVTQWYLPLRMKAMHEELGWTNHPVSLPENLRDQFDRDAIQLGYFKATEFAGAIRLVLATGVQISRRPVGSELIAKDLWR